MSLDRRLWVPLLVAVFLIVQVWAAHAVLTSDRDHHGGSGRCDGGAAYSSAACFR